MKFKKCVSMSVIILFLISCICIKTPMLVKAEPTEENVIIQQESSATKKYSDYLDSTATFAKNDVKIDAKNYVTNDAEVAEKILDGINAVAWTNEEGSLTYNVDISETGLYSLEVSYYALEGRESAIQIGVLVDGEYPFDEAKNIRLTRMFVDDGEIRSDGVGNEFAPEQKEIFGWQKKYLSNSDGDYKKEYLFLLTEGKHTLTVELHNEPVAFESFTFGAPSQELLSYENYANALDGKNYAGKPIVIEGESAFLKSDNSLVAKSDNSDPSVNPCNSFYNKINYIGGNWKNVGDTLVWKVDVKESAWYKIGFHVRQNTVLNGLCYRSMQIDGKTLFAEMDTIPFGYDSGWYFTEIQTSNGEEALVYLDAGEHELSMTVTLGEMTDVSRELSEVVYNLGELYRDMVRITGEDPDDNRSYDLFNQIPELEDELKNNIAIIEKLATQIETLTGSKGGTSVATMRAMIEVMDQMIKYSYQAHQYVQNFYSNYSSIGALVFEMRSMPIDLDAIYLMEPSDNFSSLSSNFWEKLKHSVSRFLASFIVDYSSISGKKDANGEELQLWVNWGLDQSRVLNSLIDSSFTQETGINVSVKITNATVAQAILSGNGPDMVLNMSRSEPVNLAMRGALYDLTKFSDYEDVEKRFMSGATIPFEFGEGVYALPDTQSFYVLFYRTDIFEELDLYVPKTWDEFLAVSAVIQRNNMGVGIPYTQITQTSQINTGSGALSIFPTILNQYGGEMYNESHTEITFEDATTINAFNFWTKLYTDYSFPVTYDFYNRFRVGTMPMGIQLYTMYNTIDVLAPEIEGRWSMAEIPGMLTDDGEINNSQVGGSTGCVILNDSDNIDGAWEFLKWWTREDIQYRFTSNVESILGATARVATSNIQAMQKLSWSKQDLNTLNKAWGTVEEMAEIPGGYYVPRAIDQCFWNIIYRDKTTNDVLAEWKESVDEEIAEMRKAYQLDK